MRFRPIASMCVVVAAMGAPPVTEELNTARVHELARRVESMLERDFATIPPVVIATSAEIERALRLDVKGRAIAAGATEDEASRTVEQGAITIALQVPRLSALYLSTSKQIMLQPAVLEALVERGVVPASERPRVMQLLVVHELVHALQDQEVGLNAFLTPKETDPVLRTERLYARRAVVEGQAMLVQDLVGKSLAQEAPQWSAAVTAAGRIAPGALEPEGDRERYREGIVYRGGEALMRDRYEAGGAAATWALFREPPENLAAVASLSSAFDSAFSARLAEAIDAECASFGPTWRAKATFASPAVALASQLASLPKDRRDELIDAIRGIVVVMAGTEAGARMAVAIVVARDESAAPVLDRGLLEMQTAALKAMGSKAPQQVDSYIGGFQAIGRREKVNLAGTELAVVMLHGCKGLATIQVTAVNSDHDLSSLRDISMRCLRAIEEVRNAEPPTQPRSD